jgi:hypothetical protein
VVRYAGSFWAASQARSTAGVSPTRPAGASACATGTGATGTGAAGTGATGAGAEKAEPFCTAIVSSAFANLGLAEEEADFPARRIGRV